jgi:hypothetical protein
VPRKRAHGARVAQLLVCTRARSQSASGAVTRQPETGDYRKEAGVSPCSLRGTGPLRAPPLVAQVSVLGLWGVRLCLRPVQVAQAKRSDSV